MVREAHNLLLLPLVAHLRAAEDDDDLGREALEQAHDLRGLAHVPDVNAQPDDARPTGQKLLHDVQRALLYLELQQRGAGLKRAEIRVEVAQPERAVDELGVERGE